MPGATIADARAVTGGDDPRLSMIFTFEHMDVDHAPTWGGRYDPRPFDLRALKSIMARWQEGLAGAGWNSLYFGNHDQARSVSRFGSRDPQFAQRSATLLATVLHLHRGTPYVYQGDELGMTNYPFAGIEEFRDVDALNSWERARSTGVPAERLLAGLRQNGRDNARTPMQWDASPTGGFTTGTPWLAVNPNTAQVNAATQAGDDSSVLAHYRRLIRLRHHHAIVALGDFVLLVPEHESLWAFTRSHGSETWLVTANLSEASLDLTDLAHLPDLTDADLLLSNLDSAGARPGMLRPWEVRILRIAA
jgi:oligo-1,6-glucosidase